MTFQIDIKRMLWPAWSKKQNNWNQNHISPLLISNWTSKIYFLLYFVLLANGQYFNRATLFPSFSLLASKTFRWLLILLSKVGVTRSQYFHSLTLGVTLRLSLCECLSLSVSLLLDHSLNLSPYLSHAPSSSLPTSPPLSLFQTLSLSVKNSMSGIDQENDQTRCLDPFLFVWMTQLKNAAMDS